MMGNPAVPSVWSRERGNFTPFPCSKLKPPQTPITATPVLSSPQVALEMPCCSPPPSAHVPFGHPLHPQCPLRSQPRQRRLRPGQGTAFYKLSAERIARPRHVLVHVTQLPGTRTALVQTTLYRIVCWWTLSRFKLYKIAGVCRGLFRVCRRPRSTGPCLSCCEDVCVCRQWKTDPSKSPCYLHLVGSYSADIHEWGRCDYKEKLHL